MARKSRKPARPDEAGKIPEQKKEAIEWRAALYARLSVEDARKKADASIDQQIALLEQFAQRQGLQIAGRFADRGESGTHFHRPAFSKMMEEIRAGRVNCVIVKDLSRLGRNHIETGNFLESIFPFFAVRFIAVNDRLDSLQPTEAEVLSTPLRNLVNELYARDISRKVRSQFAVKQKKGQFLGTFAPYGYRKAAENRHRLEIDPMAAPVVQKIFALRLAGESGRQIAKALDQAGILPPGEYRRQGVLYGAVEKAGGWHHSAVERILRNPAYSGVMAQGRQQTGLFCGKRRELPREEWKIVPDTHPPIVSPSDFLQAQNVSQNFTKE